MRFTTPIVRCFKKIMQRYTYYEMQLLSTRKSISRRSFIPSSSCYSYHCTCGQNRQNIYLVDESGDEADVDSVKFVDSVNKYVERTFTCAQLRIEHVGLRVKLAGWLEFQRMNKFLILRDGYGQTQVLISDENQALKRRIDKLPYESVLGIEGTVLARPPNMVNKNIPTGDIEVLIEKFEVLNESKELPFNIRDFQKPREALRMQYRYLDLRFPNMQKNLRVRSEVCMRMREFLVREAGFIDVETPTLFKATPGGAQEFVVPTKFPGQFYSLTQSPQQFKQMLMCGAVDRYFQIARCYRDETSRPDRQPEFTQLDIEMSFTNMEGVLELAEELVRYCWPPFLKPLPQKFQRMNYNDAMEIYGTDKPDTRYSYKIKNCTKILNMYSHLSAEVNNFYAGCLVFKDPHVNITKSVKEKLSVNHFAKTKLILHKMKTLENFMDKASLIGESACTALWDELDLEENDVVFLVLGEKTNCLKRLGKLRVDYVNYLEENGHMIKKDEMNFTWIVNFPLFEEGDLAGSLTSAHHPFTAPHPDDVGFLDSKPLQVRGQSYDLVLNGQEIAGGSIRIHSRAQQEKILSLLNIKTGSLKHMLEMLESGCPPHGGIAFGLDRFISEMLTTSSIRDVIAFPKTFDGKDPLSGAPSPISEKDKKLYHIQSVSWKEKGSN